jgi:hypothetical protein
MGAIKTVAAVKRDADEWPQLVWREIREHLEVKRDQVYEAIRRYPPPIPACDVQFNYLLEERSCVAQELSRLNTLSKQKLPWQDQVRMLDEFLTTATCLNEEAKKKVRIFLEQANSRLPSEGAQGLP